MNEPEQPVENQQIKINDQAIKAPEEDRLGRNAFAGKLAKDLSRWRGDQSIVVGLNGKWGSGKSSVKNLILHALNKDDTPLDYVEFNPWLASGEEAITKAFFDEIAQKLETVDDENKEERLRKWRGYARYLSIGSKLASSVEVAGLFIPGLAALGATGKAAFDQVESLTQTAADSLQSSEASLTTMKKELIEIFRDLPKPLLVVIDDIDRLTKEEIRLMVQLIKSNVDFPNITYLLLYQRSTIAEALHGVLDKDGYQYLQKIVQIDLDIPDPRPQKLREFLNNVIRACFDRTKFSTWDRSRWNTVASNILWPLYQEPRQIVRLDVMLNFHLEAHTTNGWLNVNFIDLLLIESLRIHFPNAYKETSRFFSGDAEDILSIYSSDVNKNAPIKRGIEAASAKLKSSPKEQAILHALMHQLFPQASEHFSQNATIEQRWFCDLRICHSRHFPKYFHLNMEPDEIPYEDIVRLLSENTSPKDIRAICKSKFNNRTGFDELMNYLRALKEDIPESLIPILIYELFELSDSLPQNDESDYLDTGGSWRLCEIIHNLLAQIPEEAERNDIILSYCQSATVLDGLVYYLDYYANTDKENPRNTYLLTEKILISQSAIDQAKEEIAAMLQRKAETGELLVSPNAGSLVKTLGKWGKGDQVKQWARSLVLKTKDLMLLLKALMHIGQTVGGEQSWTNYTFDPKELELFLTPNDLKPIPTLKTEDPLELRIVIVIQDWISGRAKPMGDGHLYVANRVDATGAILGRPDPDMPFSNN